MPAMKKLLPFGALAGVLCAMTLLLRLQGRLWTCACGYVRGDACGQYFDSVSKKCSRVPGRRKTTLAQTLVAPASRAPRDYRRAAARPSAWRRGMTLPLPLREVAPIMMQKIDRLLYDV